MRVGAKIDPQGTITGQYNGPACMVTYLWRRQSGRSEAGSRRPTAASANCGTGAKPVLPYTGPDPPCPPRDPVGGSFGAGLASGRLRSFGRGGAALTRGRANVAGSTAGPGFRPDIPP